MTHTSSTTPQPKEKLNVTVFVLSAVIVVAVALSAIFAPRFVSGMFGAAVEWTGRWFGSFYILLATVILIFVVVLSLTRIGKVRLGPDDATPDFSTFSWAAMLFAAGIGTGIMFFAVAEPIAQYLAPPTGDPQTTQAARDAVVFTMFHYGITGWGMYALVGMAMAYFAYRYRERLTVRSTLRPLLGKLVDGVLGDIVDAAALVGGVFGIAASLGVGVVQLNVGLELLFGFPQEAATQVGLALLSVIVATISAVSGVDRGVRILSNLNVILAIGLALWVLICGDTAFLIDALVGNVGDFLHQFPSLTLETYAYNDPRPTQWLNDWTLFFWAWWITWAAFVGMFLARISRGLTIRQFVLGSLSLPFAYVVMWVSIFGNTALGRVLKGDMEFAELTRNTPEQGLYALLQQVPGGAVLVALSVFVGILFFVTSADSGALVMSNLSSRLPSSRRDAAPWLRIFWAAVTGMLTVAMLLAGGIPILQQATIVMALPFSFVLILIMVCLWRALRAEPARTAARRQAASTLVTGAALNRTSWRDRLSLAFDIVSPARARKAVERRVAPALEAVAAELREKGLRAAVVVQGAEAGDPEADRPVLGRAVLLAGTELDEAAPALDQANSELFQYVVWLTEAPVSAFGAVVHEADDVTVRLEVRTAGGRSYDVMGWSADQIAHDVLDHYERWADYRD